MTLISIFGLAIALFVLAATPGPGVFAVISRSLASGFVPSLSVIAGIITGDIIFLLFAVLGLSVIAQTMGTLFVVIKIIGGAYLIFLGIKIWLSDPLAIQETTSKKSMGYGNYLSGLAITLSNPKVILFYCGFLPNFMVLSSLGMVDICMVVTIVSLVVSSVLIVYAYLANRARQFFSNAASVSRLNKTAGSIMIATGAAIAVKS